MSCILVLVHILPLFLACFSNSRHGISHPSLASFRARMQQAAWYLPNSDGYVHEYCGSVCVAYLITPQNISSKAQKRVGRSYLWTEYMLRKERHVSVRYLTMRAVNLCRVAHGSHGCIIHSSIPQPCWQTCLCAGLLYYLCYAHDGLPLTLRLFKDNISPVKKRIQPNPTSSINEKV